MTQLFGDLTPYVYGLAAIAIALTFFRRLLFALVTTIGYPLYVASYPIRKLLSPFVNITAMIGYFLILAIYFMVNRLGILRLIYLVLPTSSSSRRTRATRPSESTYRHYGEDEVPYMRVHGNKSYRTKSGTERKEASERRNGSNQEEATYHSRTRAPQTPPRVPDAISKAFAAFGLQPGASFSDVKRAFRTLSKQCHPDRRKDHGMPADKAHRKQVELNGAFELLTRRFSMGE